MSSLHGRLQINDILQALDTDKLRTALSLPAEAKSTAKVDWLAVTSGSFAMAAGITAAVPPAAAAFGVLSGLFTVASVRQNWQ